MVFYNITSYCSAKDGWTLKTTYINTINCFVGLIWLVIVTEFQLVELGKEEDVFPG
jgi:hypothetical protein